MKLALFVLIAAVAVPGFAAELALVQPKELAAVRPDQAPAILYIDPAADAGSGIPIRHGTDAAELFRRDVSQL